MTLDGLNWNDHSCYNYSNTLDVATAVTILANATAEVGTFPPFLNSNSLKICAGFPKALPEDPCPHFANSDTELTP
jgi:hypothetical protein